MIDGVLDRRREGPHRSRLPRPREPEDRSFRRLAIGGYLGSKDGFDQAIADFSAAYADRNEADFGLLESAAAEGRIEVAQGI